MNTLNGSYCSTLTLHPTPLHLTCTGVFTSPLVAHPSSLTTCSLTVSVPRSPQIRDGSCLSVHIILDDPAGNSYIQNVYAPEEDPELKVELYTRSPEQNELLGLDQMNVD